MQLDVGEILFNMLVSGAILTVILYILSESDLGSWDINGWPAGYILVLVIFLAAVFIALAPNLKRVL